MNTSQIKNFATQSRNILKTGVIQRIQILGFDANGNLTKGEPTRIDIQGGATLFAGEIFDGAFYDRWMSLRRRIEEKGVKEVYEEAAYTWFNRLVAIRIMMKNGFIDPVLAYTNEETRIPRIVAEARAGRFGKMSTSDREKLRELMGDDARINEQFALLIDNFCRNNAVIFNCFGGIEEYISLLLPDNILAPGGFIDLLNHTNYITDEDFKQSELIGWLYQFYISEKKDEVYAKVGKYEANDIPAATQIFTPNWIVKYMVQNTIGRIYLDNNPWATGIKESMKYLVPASYGSDRILKLDSVEDYKLLDSACGSGHILVEAFDLFYKIYLEEGYSSHNAIENILQKNLLGIDLDTRAKQLATFALLMTATKIDPSFLDCKVMPRVMDMPGNKFSKHIYELLREFYMGEDRTVMDETVKAFVLLEKADTLGSIMHFNLSAKTRKEMALRYKEWSEVESSSPVKEILHSISLILALSDKYAAVVMNPPYMGSGRFDKVLAGYVEKNYREGKADLFSVFMLVGMNSLINNGKMGMINMHAWMFISAFESLRSSFLENYTLESLLHLGARTFDELSGEVVQNSAFVISKNSPGDYKGFYYRLVEENNCAKKEKAFLNALHQENSPIVFNNSSQTQFELIPGAPISYWVSENLRNAIQTHEISRCCETRCGLATGNNDYYLRAWYEIAFPSIAFGMSRIEAKASKKKWFPYNNAGGFRKWYGLFDTVINWYDDGHEMQTKLDPTGKRIWAHNFNLDMIFKPHIGWSDISTNGNTFRMYPKGCLFTSNAAFPVDSHQWQILGIANSNITREVKVLLNPTLHFTPGNFANLPYDMEKMQQKAGVISPLSKKCVEIEKLDWDAHEFSWDFKENELFRIYKENHGEGVFMDANRLGDIVAIYKEYWTGLFNQLHSNEEELNQQLIEIYGLQEDLTSDVPLNEITILQQGEISVEGGQMVWHNDVLAKQLLSYAIGCMMGRYRLDRPGLHIAYPNPSAADVEAYDFQDEKFEIDDDGIIPLLSRDCPFDDNAYNRIVKFIRQVFGDSFLNENLNFIEDSLGKTIENYFIKDFWKDHKKLYSSKPIYWLFSSKKGAFQCLAYMHRMNPYTAEAVRSKYLLPYIDFLKNKIAADMERASSLSTVERKNLDKMQAALDECLEYEERLHDMADRQVRFDLDDGVLNNYALFGDVLAPIK